MRSRRAFLTALGGLLAWPRFAWAQQAERTYRVGWLSTAALRTEPYNLAFVDRLREVGFVEDRNLVIVFRSAQGRIDRLTELASDLAQQNCDVFLSPGSEGNLAAIKQASRDTPIVVVAIDYDPVATGHISSLARPGGRITGVSLQQTDLAAKRLELLKEVLPRAKRIAVFSDTSTVGQLKEVQAGAKRLGVALQVLEFGWPDVPRGTVRRRVPACRELRRQDPQGSEAGYLGCRAADTIRASDQPQDCEGARSHHRPVAAAAGGSGD